MLVAGWAVGRQCGVCARLALVVETLPSVCPVNSALCSTSDVANQEFGEMLNSSLLGCGLTPNSSRSRPTAIFVFHNIQHLLVSLIDVMKILRSRNYKII